MKTEQPSPVVLSIATIADGKFYAAGAEVPFTKATLPEHLRPYIAEPSEVAAEPEERFATSPRMSSIKRTPMVAEAGRFVVRSQNCRTRPRGSRPVRKRRRGRSTRKPRRPSRPNMISASAQR